MSELEELNQDVEEAKVLLESISRQRWKNLLLTELQNLEMKIRDLKLTNEKTGDAVRVTSSSKIYTMTIRNYSWDQSNTFLKLYVTLPGIQALTQKNVCCNFGKKSLMLKVSELEGKNYELTISHLAYSINPEKSYFKIKTDMLVVFASKQSIKQWEAVTAEEKRILDAKKATKKEPKSDDPTSGLMDLMKQMYDDGDDEMKRMLNKTWYESQKKVHSNSDIPDFGDKSI